MVATLSGFSAVIFAPLSAYDRAFVRSMPHFASAAGEDRQDQVRPAGCASHRGASEAAR
jgi:hypothetical protein